MGRGRPPRPPKFPPKVQRVSEIQLEIYNIILHRSIGLHFYTYVSTRATLSSIIIMNTPVQLYVHYIYVLVICTHISSTHVLTHFCKALIRRTHPTLFSGFLCMWICLLRVVVDCRGWTLRLLHESGEQTPNYSGSDFTVLRNAVCLVSSTVKVAFT